MDNSEHVERLKQLLDRSGKDFVQGVLDEINILHRELTTLKREVSALADFESSRGLALVPPGTAAALLPKSVTIEADQMLRPNDGFYGVEYTSDGTAFRWTGPSVQFCFSVFVDRSEGAYLNLHALTSIDFSVQKHVTLICDGETIAVDIKHKPPGFGITAFLPPREAHGVTSLVFVLPAVLTPLGSADARPLGIAFARLSVSAHQLEAEGTGVSDRMAAQ